MIRLPQGTPVEKPLRKAKMLFDYHLYLLKQLIRRRPRKRHAAIAQNYNFHRSEDFTGRCSVRGNDAGQFVQHQTDVNKMSL